MLAFFVAVLAAPQLRTLDSLPGLPGGPHSVAYALNEAGEVAGIAQGRRHDARPVVWRGGELVELGIIPGDVEGAAFGINDAGEVCGQSIGSGVLRAVLWRGGAIVDLGHLGVPAASATALNDAGMVVGNSYPAGGLYTHGFRWTRAAGMTDLGTLGGEYSAATCVDAAGNAYGVATDAAGRNHAVIWPAGGGPAQRLDALDQLGFSSIARGCSPSGIVVGDGYDLVLGERGFAWSAVGGLRLLPPPPGTTVRFAQDVNDAGQALVYGGDLRLWIHDLTAGSWTDAGAELPPFPRASLGAAYEINGAGQIAGHGYDFATGAPQSAWLLAPAPDGFGLGEPLPGVAGAPGSLGAAGLTPGATVRLFASRVAGSTAVPGCGSLSLDLHQPSLLAVTAADAQGVVQWLGVAAPAGLAGRRVLLQAAELSTCRVSNLSSVDFR